ncbi:MAG: SDR family oxidoreductase [Bacteroidetes bacterium]|nr:SDR family oxidoreductase [Bacteroidota bacterium]
MTHHLLKGKRGLIFGALDEKSLAWKVALRAKKEGADITLTNTPVAIRMGKINELAKECDADVIPADVTSLDDIQTLFNKVTGKGNIDFILHSVGMSPNVRKGYPYTELNYEYFLKTLDISALSLHKLLQTAYRMDAINEWGSVVTLTYISAQRTMPGYGDMTEAKAMLESIVRNFGYYYGKAKRVRINSISQSPTKTTAGTGISGFDKIFEYAQRMAPLGNASADACADYCITLFSDLTRMVTMQNLFHDGGFSTTLASEEILNNLEELSFPDVGNFRNG